MKVNFDCIPFKIIIPFFINKKLSTLFLTGSWKPGKLIYFSMGAFPSAYSLMMKWLVELLKDSPQIHCIKR